MKILVLSQFFPPDITAAAFRVADTLEHLAGQGHELRVITAQPHKAQVEDEDGSTRLPEGVKVYRRPIAEVGEGGFRRYLKHYLSFCLGSVREGIRLRRSGWRPDVIWATSPPLFVGLSGRILGTVFGRPWVLDVRDIWPDSAVSAGQLGEGGRAYRIGKKLEHYLYRKAGAITCVARPMSEYIERESGRSVRVIYNGVKGRDQEAPADSPPPERVEKSLLFAGNLGRVQALDMVVKAFAELEKAGELGVWRLRMIGAGAMEDELKRLVEERGIAHRVDLDSPMTREAVMKEMAASEALFLSLKPDLVLALTIPSKVFDYLLAARPVVGGIVGEGREILESTGANVCYDPRSLEALKEALRHLFAHYETMSKVAGGNRSQVLERYSREEGGDRLIAVLEGCIGKGKA